MPSPKIVVIGSSYSAAAIFNYLERSLSNLREPFDLLLISDKNHYLNTDLLSSYLCDSCNLDDTCQWLRGVAFLRAGVSYLQAEVSNIDFQSKTISTLKGEINYQYLVLAPNNDLFDEPDIKNADNTFIVKSLSDILKLRTHILNNLEKAIFENDPDIKNSLLTFSIIGTGKEGIQLACSISDFANRLVKNYFPKIKKSLLKFNLIEENNIVTLNRDPFYNNRIFYNLSKKNITLYTNSKPTQFENNSGTTIITGLKDSSSLIRNLKSTCNVDLYMKLESTNDVFMIGETANYLDLGEDLKKTNFFYKNQAKICSANICTKINNTSMKLLKPDFQIDFLSLGYRNSLAEIKNVYIDGIPGWILHRLSSAFCSLSWKKKLRAFAGLIFNIFGLSDFEQLNIYELKTNKQVVKK